MSTPKIARELAELMPDKATLSDEERKLVYFSLRSMADEVERLRKFEPKGGQHVGPSVGPIARLKQENRDLKAEVAWLETPIRARHKALLAAAEEILTERDRVAANARLREAIDDCKRNGP